jgi:hypothetical protein
MVMMEEKIIYKNEAVCLHCERKTRWKILKIQFSLTNENKIISMIKYLIINWGKEMWEILGTPARWHNNFCEK